jgi:hypothetical protein
MSWIDLFHISLCLYLIVIFVWVQHLMIKMTRLERELYALYWTLKKEREERHERETGHTAEAHRTH